jgi:uncharacterized membrane protein YgdD (TMEM256/DUF423 family)
MNARTFALLGAMFGFAAVAAGAFGAHALRSRLAADAMVVFETAVRYHLVHALALFAVAWVASQWPSGPARLSGWLFVLGIALFSGSLYALAVTGVRHFGVIAPFGGLSLLAGWLALAWSVWRGGPRG